jgi:hypothetical protein
MVSMHSHGLVEWGGGGGGAGLVVGASCNEGSMRWV